MTSKTLVSIEETSTSQRAVKFGNKTVHYEFEGDLAPPPIRTLDFALLATIFAAMKEGADLHLCGPVSKTLLSNIEELQE